MTGEHLEALDVRRALVTPDTLRPWNDRAVLTSTDLIVALRLAGFTGEARAEVLLGAAFAVRALRLGHVCVDLRTIAYTASSEIDQGADLSDLPWPAADRWLEQLRTSPLVASGEDDRRADAARPLRLVATRLYLDRYWRQECQVAEDLDRRATADPPVMDEFTLRAGLDRLFPADPVLERDAGPDAGGRNLGRLSAAMAVGGRLAVVAGGPGTGKTTAVARILALIGEQHTVAGVSLPRVALAAPTGKAAARLAEAVHDEAEHMELGSTVREWLVDLDATTLHRLLGWRPDSASRFRHDRHSRLAHDVVIVDETSMLSLSLMAKLVDAVRPDARLVLVGDPQQLASVEAGAVLGDVVGPAASGMVMSAPGRERLAALAGVTVAAMEAPHGVAIADRIVVLRHVHRFAGGIAELARAVAAGDAERSIALLDEGRHDLRWVRGDPALVREDVVATGTAVEDAASHGRAGEAMRAMTSRRVLCAHREGPAGVSVWNERIESWLRGAVPNYGSAGRWYPGRPLLVTENDYELQLYNGDTGVVVTGEGDRPVAVFERRGLLREVAPNRLRAVETVHAMTVHKSQGSQFDEVVVVLPDTDGPLLTRELLYTAVTRARRRTTIVGGEAVLRAGVERPIARASGLRPRLWGA